MINTWSIECLTWDTAEAQLFPKKVTEVAFKVESSRGPVYMARIKLAEPAEETFILWEDLTEDIVIQWVQAELRGQADSIESMLNEMAEDPFTQQGAPWKARQES